MLKDRDEVARGKAVVALGKIGEPAVEPLIAALKDEDAGVRWGAAVALGKIKDVGAVEPLIAAVKNKDVKFDAVLAALLLKEIGKPAVEPLIAALKDKEKRVRWFATEALRQIGDARAIGPLEELARNDPDEGIRQDTRSALAKLRGAGK